MATIILSMRQDAVQVLSFPKNSITVGCRSHDAVMIDDIAISAVLAAIVTKIGESVPEDLNSTNGNQVNELAVKRALPAEP